MKSRPICLALVLLSSPLCGPSAAGVNWPQFRGPQASGVSEGATPLNWDVGKGQNVLWQTPIPGLAHASPILWENRLYLTTAVRPGAKADLKVGLYGDGDSYKEAEPHLWRLLCLDKASGRMLWDQLGHESVPRLERHTKATHCNSTPATDGQRIVAMFGSEGLFCFDMEGRRLWHKDLGKLHAGPFDAPSMQWGFASSPVLHEGKVILQCDTLSEQFLALFDAADGRELWRVKREEVTVWSTPIVALSPGRKQIVLNGWKHIGGYDFDTGRELWRLSEGGDIPVASPILAADLVILTSGHGKYRPMRAVRLDADGDITPPEMGATNRFVVWCHPRKGNYLQTPIAVGDLLWGCLDNGVVTCFDVKTGKLHYEERLGKGNQGFSASPVAANGHLYFTSEQGEVFVLAATHTFSVLATNLLGGISLSTPAISEGVLFFRTTEKMLALGLPATRAGAEAAAELKPVPETMDPDPKARWPRLFEPNRRIAEPNEALRAILAGHQGPGFAAEFTEEKHITVLDRPLRSSGALIYQEKFGLYRKMTAPFQQELLIGRNELLRREEDGRVETVTGGGDAMAKTFATAFLSLFAGSWEALNDHFNVYYLPETDGWALGLLPRKKALEKLVSGVVLRGRDLFLTELWIVEARGDWTHAVFSNMRKLSSKEAKDLEPLMRWGR